MLSKIETIDFSEYKLYHLNTQKQKGGYFSNFTKLFLLLLSTICTVIYIIRLREYSSLEVPFTLCDSVLFTLGGTGEVVTIA